MNYVISLVLTKVWFLKTPDDTLFPLCWLIIQLLYQTSFHHWAVWAKSMWNTNNKNMLLTNLLIRWRLFVLIVCFCVFGSGRRFRLDSRWNLDGQQRVRVVPVVVGLHLRAGEGRPPNAHHQPQLRQQLSVGASLYFNAISVAHFSVIFFALFYCLLGFILFYSVCFCIFYYCKVLLSCHYFVCSIFKSVL